MFYRGTVEDNNDPGQFGRVKVRVHGIHDEGSEVSTGELPWAEVAGGTDFGLSNGIGVTSILRIGTMVWCFFNNDDYNYPIIFAVVKGSSDINSVAKGSYTNIATIKSPGGHIIELNDSSPKIEIKHSSGSKLIFQPDGSILIESVNNIVYQASGNFDITSGGNINVTASGNLGLTASRIDFNG